MPAKSRKQQKMMYARFGEALAKPKTKRKKPK